MHHMPSTVPRTLPLLLSVTQRKLAGQDSTLPMGPQLSGTPLSRHQEPAPGSAVLVFKLKAPEIYTQHGNELLFPPKG